MEEDGRIDVRAAVEIEDKFPTGLIMVEDLHFKTRRSVKLFLFGEEAPEIPRHSDGSTVFAAAMLQFLLHLLWRGIAQ